MRRAHRLVRETFGDSDDPLCHPLRASPHLPLVSSGETARAGEHFWPVGLYVEQVEQAADRPLCLIRGHCRFTSPYPYGGTSGGASPIRAATAIASHVLWFATNRNHSAIGTRH